AMGLGPLLAWRRTSTRALWRNLGVPAIAAAACAAILPLAGIRDIWANVGFAVCSFTAGAILYELWRGMRVRHSHGESYPVALYMLVNRYRQRYGGYLVHLGLVLLAVGVIGSHFFQVQRDATLKSGQAMNIAGYKLLYFGNYEETYPGTDTVKSILQIYQDDQLKGYIYPGRTFYQNFGDQPASLISISTFGLTDVYVFLADWNGSSQATIRVFINPLTSLVWYGGVLMLIGGIICWWPARRKQSVVDSVSPVAALATPTAKRGQAAGKAQDRSNGKTGGPARQRKAVTAESPASSPSRPSPANRTSNGHDDEEVVV
ncbi:MAG TPA: cytochrome c-type biogenesis CcmF C-terminal domain-containing protein, partial [Ktedonobacteraceae bacterium]|nr:cytochrome c-type biogenesis CcmF C-terminal domain-containing protein [Ktedonobacteraceae bacterium]